MNQLENCQARYRSNTWMGRTRTDGPDEFEPTKLDCMKLLRKLEYARHYFTQSELPLQIPWNQTSDVL